MPFKEITIEFLLLIFFAISSHCANEDSPISEKPLSEKKRCSKDYEAAPLSYNYHIPETLVFDLRKKYSASFKLVLKNKDNKTTKFRYYLNSPIAYFYNKETKKYIEVLTTGMTLPTYFKDRETVNSVFWALLNVATWHYPVKPKESISVDLEISVSSRSPGIATMPLLLRESENLEIHLYNTCDTSPFGYQWDKQNKRSLILDYPYRPPDAIITSIRVIPCKHADFCRMKKNQ